MPNFSSDTFTEVPLLYIQIPIYPTQAFITIDYARIPSIIGTTKNTQIYSRNAHYSSLIAYTYRKALLVREQIRQSNNKSWAPHVCYTIAACVEELLHKVMKRGRERGSVPPPTTRPFPVRPFQLLFEF